MWGREVEEKVRTTAEEKRRDRRGERRDEMERRSVEARRVGEEKGEELWKREEKGNGSRVNGIRRRGSQKKWRK